jgi:hypothetical protein
MRYPYYSCTKSGLLLICILLLTRLSYAQSTIPFDVTPQGHILVKAKVNGVEGNFIFDTGAGLTLITKTFSEKIGKLHKQDGTYTGFRATGEKLTAELYDGQTVALGDFTEHDPVITIFDVNLGTIDGLISLMSFKKQPLTIDYINKKLVFETEKSLSAIRKTGNHIPLQLEESREKALTIFAYFMVNDKLTLQLSMDSGAGSNSYRFNSKYIAALGVDTVNANKIVIPSEFDPKIKTVIYQSTVKSIAAKASPVVDCKDVKASFIDGLIYDGIISINWLGKQITFDLQKREMIVQK